MGAPHGPATPRWPSPVHAVHDLHASIERKRVTMNDPHVVALVYRIEHGPDIDWSQAAPLDKEEDSFDVRVENRRVRFALKEHYASETEARCAVEADYIPNWEFVVGLTRGPNAFSLHFDRSQIVDRNPPPGPSLVRVHFKASCKTGETSSFSA